MVLTGKKSGRRDSSAAGSEFIGSKKPKRDGVKLNQHRAPGCCSCMIFIGKPLQFFRIML
jgi:hypothetical protein